MDEQVKNVSSQEETRPVEINKVMWSTDKISPLESDESYLSPVNDGERGLPPPNSLVLLIGLYVSSKEGLVIPTRPTDVLSL